MEAKIQSQIIDYFSSFEEFFLLSKVWLKDCQNCAVAINKLIKRCNNIKEAEVTGTPLEEFAGLQNKLCASLYNHISEEIQDIRSKLAAFEDLFEKLCDKNKAFQENCRGINFEEQTRLIRGTPLQPPLGKLLEFAEDTITFASQVCAQINSSLEVLSNKGLNTESLTQNFCIESRWQKRIPEIIAYTSFCSQNKI